MIIESWLFTWSPKSQHKMKKFVIFLGLFAGLASSSKYKKISFLTAKKIVFENYIHMF